MTGALLPPAASETSKHRRRGSSRLLGAAARLLLAGSAACSSRVGIAILAAAHFGGVVAVLLLMGGEGGTTGPGCTGMAPGSLPSSAGGEHPERVAVMTAASDPPPPPAVPGGWTWFDGDLNEYYNKLERDEHAKRNSKIISSYAVHRWMGRDRSTLRQYELIRQSVREFLPAKELRVFDAGCGLGAGLMWFERNEPSWTLLGHTVSEAQYKWITNDLPPHKFNVDLKSYDEPPPGRVFDAFYSIEAMVHAPDLAATLGVWSDHLSPGGVVVVIDDFLSVGVPRHDEEVDLFARSWLASSVVTTTQVANLAETVHPLVRDRDLTTEFGIVKLNYRNKAPELKDEQGRVHQGWLGSKVRQRLTVNGKISYRMVVLRKDGG